jgi:hypothetical protein
MPILNCLCDRSINLSIIPNPQGYKLISEPLLETIIETLVAARDNANFDLEGFETLAYDLFHLKRPSIPQVYECLHCGRIALLVHPSESDASIWFQREKKPRENLESIVSLSRSW